MTLSYRVFGNPSEGAMHILGQGLIQGANADWTGPTLPASLGPEGLPVLFGDGPGKVDHG